MPRYEFTTGQVLTADQMNDLSDQTVMTFAGTAARGSAIPSPTEGMVTYLSDTNELQVFDGSAFSAIGQSAILQVVSTAKTDSFSVGSIASGAFSAVTGLTVSITPTSTSSKILVLVSVSGAHSTGYGFVSFRLMRDSTAIGIGDAAGSRSRVTGSQTPAFASDNLGIATADKVFLDSPNTTSSITYGVELHNSTSSNGVTLYVNRSLSDVDGVARVRTISTITAIEVAG